MPDAGSPFLRIPASEWIASNRFAFAVRDAFPVSPGHTLVVPRRLIATWWDATDEERVDILALVDRVKALLDAELQPDGYNIGINSGVAAGQTVDHLHVHVIPRFHGDVADPRGGVRHVVPGRGNYLLASSAPASFVDGQDRLLREDLLRCLRDSRFDRVDLLVSFVMKSGLAQVKGGLLDAVDRGARIRVLTTDYLDVTDPDALAQLLDLAEANPSTVATRVFHDPVTSFHPKAFLFHSGRSTRAVAFVGSNNLSASGIAGGIEWTVGVDQVAPMLEAFDRLWADARSRPLTHALLRAYRGRRRVGVRVPTAEAEAVAEAPPTPPVPRPVQHEALDALVRTRLEGFRAGLVVMATGLGKTWLAAFDSARPQFRRVLFVAHREEILRQSLDVFRQVQPDADLGLFHGGEKEPDAPILFASVQTLVNNLGRFAPERFDYVVVDEFHHAEARSYRRVLGHFRPRFLLGLTATPNRMDGADLLALCSDNLVYECSLGEGIERDELSRFRYFGLRDDVDYTPIPWRGGRFDAEALTEAVETQQRARHAFEVWRAKGAGPTLGFCVTVTHADFMADFFRKMGVRAVAVHSGPTSAVRRGSVDDLRRGELDAIFTVDVFNEGIDVPEVETVLLLRPTESPVVFLQQLGRGLRKSQGKQALTIVDFIGNHRSFLVKPRTLLALGGGEVPSDVRVLRAMRSGEFPLPAGCSVSYDPQLVDVLWSVARLGVRSALEDYCRSYTDEHGRRPTAVQAYEAGHKPASARSRNQHWFEFLDDLELLEPSEQAVVRRHGDVLEGIERERVTKAYKLVTLQALVQLGALRRGAGITEIAWTARRIVTGDPRLVADAQSEEMPDPAAVSDETWRRFWLEWPLSAWAGRRRGRSGRAWFRIEGSRFLPTFQVDALLGEAFDEMVEELVDYRLARYLLKKDDGLRAAARLKVIQNQGRPILMLDRERNRGLPMGEQAFVADGVTYRGNFVEIALDVARREGHHGNALPALLTGWFGPSAGQPGTTQYVELGRSGRQWEMRPVHPAADPPSNRTVGPG